METDSAKRAAVCDVSFRLPCPVGVGVGSAGQQHQSREQSCVRGRQDADVAEPGVVERPPRVDQSVPQSSPAAQPLAGRQPHPPTQRLPLARPPKSAHADARRQPARSCRTGLVPIPDESPGNVTFTHYLVHTARRRRDAARPMSRVSCRAV